MLVVVTIAAVAIGIQQSHRRAIMGHVNEFGAAGAVIITDLSVWDWLWLSRPRYASINLWRRKDSQYQLGQRQYGLEETARQVNLLGDAIVTFGIPKVDVVIRDEQNRRLHTLRYDGGDVRAWLEKSDGYLRIERGEAK
jgi:hypothetical protein